MHAPDCIAVFTVSAHAPHEWRPVADAGRWATLPPAKRKGARVLLAVLLLVTKWAIASAADIETGRRHQVLEVSSKISLKDRETFDFQALGPREFLSHLEALKHGFTVYTTHIGWLKSTDIPWLLSQATSDKPCAPVIAIYSQIAPNYPSTIGNEAVFLLLALREGRFPPRAFSVGVLNARQRTELLDWAAAQGKQ